jgi:RHS repeat-associated protein
MFAALFVIVAGTMPVRVVAQNFTAPGSLNEFSDAMVATPDTSMSVQSSDPILSANGPNGDEQVTPDPNYTQPQEPYSRDLPETVNTYEGPIGVTGIFNGNVQTACSYDPLNHSAHRAIVDIPPIPGALGKYPLQMVRYYNSRQQYYALVSGGLSPGWSHEYSWLLYGNGKKVVSPHGNVSDFSCGKPIGVSEGWDDGVQGQHANGGIWRLADGGKVVFSGGHVTDIYDPYGLRTRIAYNLTGPQVGERVKITEPGGRCLWFIYGDQDQDGTWLITRVEAYDVDGSPGSPNHPTGNLINWVNYTYANYDPILPSRSERIKRMLQRVDYPNSTNTLTDNTHAHYDYRTDNVIEGPTSHKMYPLLKRCDDVRYNGPMRTIWYDYQNHGPHGAILDETCPGVGAISAIAPGVPATDGTVDTFTESRGDGPTRSFTYTHFDPCTGDDCNGVCAAYGESEPHNRLLDHYTDFQGNITQLGYDERPDHWYINSVTDPNGHTTNYERGNPPSQGGIGEIKTITHPAGVGYPQSSIHYDYYPETNVLGGHYLYHITDENGKTTTITRDATRHWITRIDYPLDANTPVSHEEFQYDDFGFGQVKAHHLKNGAWESFAYDNRGLLTDKWNPKRSGIPSGPDPHTHYEYYTSGPWTDRVKKVTMPPNFPFSYQATESYEYDRNTSNQPCAGRGLVTKITHTDSAYRSFSYDQWGNKIHEWNELGQRIDFAYDSYNRLTTVTKWMGQSPSEVTSYTYRPTNGNGTSPYLHTTNNPDIVTSPTGIMTSNVYDENFRRTSTSVAGRTTWFDYDPVGNLRHVTDPRGSGPCNPTCDPTYTTTTGYDTRDRKWRVWDPQNHLTTFTYDNASNITRIDRPGGTWETKTYDAVNRVRDDTVSFTGGNASVSLTTWFTYNPSGTIWKVTDARGSGRGDATYTTSFQYNASDQRTGITYPPVNGHSDTQGWQYDDAHNLIWHITPDGQAHYFGYDQRNRNYEQFWWDAQSDWLWYYFGLDAADRLRDAKNGTGSVVDANTIARVHRDYDAAGRVTLDRQTILDQSNGPGLPAKYVNYEYDISLRGTAGSPTRIYATATPSPSYDYDLRYDEMGRFEKILLHGNGSLYFQYFYDPASNETQRHNQLNGVDEFYNPDSLNRPMTVDLKHNGTRLARESYDYSLTGRLRTVTRLDNKQDQFGYYLDGELFWVMYGVTGVEAPNPDETPPAEDPTKEKTPEDFLSLSGWDPNQALTADRSVTYTLDYAGNRDSVNDSVNGYTNYTPDNLNRYAVQVGNDPITNGYKHEVISYKNITYTYKDEHLISVSNPATNDSYQLAYDALGRCVKRTVNGLTKYYIYDGERPILEYGVNGNVRGKNLYGKGIDEILMRWDGTVQAPCPQTFYYQQDHEGSVAHLTMQPDQNGNVILEKYRYDVFGTPTVYDGSGRLRLNGSIVSNRFLFTGREYNANFGFYEYRARAYNPQLGRFMSEDPKLFDAGDYNLFRYCHNDPIDFTDPMGLAGEATGLLQEGTNDRVWEMTKWFDRSNLTQGNFRGFGYMSAQSEQDAKGGIATGQTSGTVKLRESYRRMNEEKLGGLDSRFAPMARRFVDAANANVNPEGLEVRIAHGTRSLAEQAELYREYLAGEGKLAAAPGRSAHNYGMAIDIAVIKGSSVVDKPAMWARLGRLGESLGLRWGHSFSDDDHFQHPGIPTSGIQLLRLHQQGRDLLTGEPLN